MKLRTLVLVLLLGCGKGGSTASTGSAGSAGSAIAPEAHAALTPDKTVDLSKLSMPPAERDQIEAFIKSNDVLSFDGLTTLTSEDASKIGLMKGRVLILSNVMSVSAEASQRLATWQGDIMFLGATSIDEKTAISLALWKGKSLHLDNVSLDAVTAARLAQFQGTTLGLAHAKIPPEAAAALAKFSSGAVAVALDPATKVDSTVSVPPAESEEDLATLGRISRAVDDGDVDAVKDFLKSGGKADMNEHGTTLLMEAANMRQVEVAKVLVAAGANVNAVSQRGDTPMSLALSDSDFGPRVKDPQAVLALAKVLVEAGAQTAPKATGGDLYRSPLEGAARLGDPALVTYLIGKGAKPTDQNALVEAINMHNIEIVDLLIKAGAVVSPATFEMGRNPILQAIGQAASDIEMARYNKKPAAEIAAIAKDRLELLDHVLAAKPDLSVRDDRGETPLEAALNGGVVEIVTKVLDAGAKVDDKDANGKTPLQFLAGNGRLEEKDTLPLAKLLIERKSPKGGAAAIAEAGKRPALAKLLR